MRIKENILDTLRCTYPSDLDMDEERLLQYMRTHEPLAIYQFPQFNFMVHQCICINGHMNLIGYKENGFSTIGITLENLNKEATLLTSSDIFNQMLNCKDCGHKFYNPI